MPTPNPLSRHERVVLITGAGRWPAPAVALAFAHSGATVILNDLSPVPLDPICAASAALPGNVTTYVADATRGMPLRAMFDLILEEHGRLDVLINNPRACPQAPLRSMDEWDWQRAMEMNVNGPFLAMQLAAGAMQPLPGETAGGVIVNIVDPPGAALQAPGLAAYGASQAALLALSESAAREFLAYNIRVYTLCPEPSGEPQALEQEVARLAHTLCYPTGAPTPPQTFTVSSSGQTPR